MSYDLKVLEDHRDDILLAEIAGLLHNLGKLDANFYINQVSDSSHAVQQVRAQNQYIDGYQFKRFAQPSAHLIDTGVQRMIASSQRIDLNALPPVANDDLGKQQLTAAENFNRFYRGTGVLDSLQAGTLNGLRVAVAGEFWLLTDLLTLFWDKEFVYKAGNDDYQRVYALAHWLHQSSTGLPLLLALAHGEMSGAEKYHVVEDKATGHFVVVGVQQTQTTFDQLRQSTAFGFEARRLALWQFQHNRRQLINRLPGQMQGISQDYSTLMSAIREALQQGLGDTQWPVNEITLWDYASSIAALFKTAIAKSFLEGRVADANAMRWRLLGLRLDGLQYRSQAQRVADLIGRNEAFAQAMQVLSSGLTYDTPIASQVYHDEHGLFFIVPEIDDLPPDQFLRLIQDLVDQKLKTHGIDDIYPHVSISERPLRGKQLNLGQEIRRLGPPHSSALKPSTVQMWWQRPSTDVCVVCNLRPQGFVPNATADQSSTSARARKRKLCGVCLARRQDRAMNWATKQRALTTIWVDEVADRFGRVAVVVGQFGLEKWLDGTLVESLALGMDENTHQPVPKFASFPRIQRVWESTQRFWQEINGELQSEQDKDHPHRLRDARRRLKLSVQADGPLSSFGTYELRLGETSLSVILVGDKSEQSLVSIDNLTYTAGQLNLPANSPVDAALNVGAWIDERRCNGKSWDLQDPPDEAGRGGELYKIRISRTDYEDSSYARIIPILAEPRTFMALVPADKALEVVQAIKAKYECEMGKVRNRLPLTLGVVYAGRRTPLAALLDAGRRMLRRPVQEVRAEVETVTPPIVTDAAWPAVREVTLRVGERQITVAVPTVMGDGTTPDHWYPYWQVADKPTDRARWFTGTDGEHWVHVCDLRAGDAVAFTPSTFDFEYLDTTARRFEVSYDGGHRRGRDKRQRPYLLGEIEQIEWAWAMVGPLPTTQIKTLVSLIETKRMDWGQPTGDLALALPADAPFRQLCRDALATTAWRGNGWKDFSDADQGLLERAALSGMLRDALEIHLEIMKEELKKEDQHEQ